MSLTFKVPSHFRNCIETHQYHFAWYILILFHGETGINNTDEKKQTIQSVYGNKKPEITGLFIHRE